MTDVEYADLHLAIAEVLASGGPVEDELDAASEIMDLLVRRGVISASTGHDPITQRLQLCDDDGIVRKGARVTDYPCTGHAHFGSEHILCTSPAHKSITCPRCGAVSYHPEDRRQGYCGRCHWWTSDPHLGAPWVIEQAEREGTLQPVTKTVS